MYFCKPCARRHMLTVLDQLIHFPSVSFSMSLSLTVVSDLEVSVDEEMVGAGVDMVMNGGLYFSLSLIQVLWVLHVLKVWFGAHNL